MSCLNLGGRSCWQGVSVFSDIRELPLSEFVISRPRPLPTQLTIWCGILGRHASALATKRQYGSLSVYIATTLMAMLMRRTHQRYPRPCSEVDGRATSRWLVPTKDATALPSKVSWGGIGLDGAWSNGTLHIAAQRVPTHRASAPKRRLALPCGHQDVASAAVLVLLQAGTCSQARYAHHRQDCTRSCGAAAGSHTVHTARQHFPCDCRRSCTVAAGARGTFIPHEL